MPKANDIQWFKGEFSADINAAVSGTPFDVDMIVAIACQETGYIWSVLRKKTLSRDEILALCVGDTIDYAGPNKGRQAFPRNKAALLARPNGERMFQIARTALVSMAAYVPGYEKAVTNPDKFCRGYGVFQRDLQFFKGDPDYFLEKKYEYFSKSLEFCLKELKSKAENLGLNNKPRLSDMEFASVAIAYNTGHYDPNKGLKQGYFDGNRYYGEYIYDFVRLSRNVGSTAAPPLALGRYVVAARGGLRLRNGPGLDFAVTKTLSPGTELTVVGSDGAEGEWARVDLEGDGLVDGHVFASFLVAAAAQPDNYEHAEEPDEEAVSWSPS